MENLIKPMDAVENLLTRNSVSKLTEPYPSKDEMKLIYKAALRAPDHAWLRPSRFIEVTGKGLEKLSNIFVDYISNTSNEVSELLLSKYKNAPFRAPMIIILVSQPKDHPKVPEIEQILSTSAAAQNILLALHALNYGAIWRTGKVALNDEIGKYFDLEKNSKILGYIYIGTPSIEPKQIPDLDIDDFVTRWE